MDTVDVLFTDSGKPWKIRRDGRVWSVAVEPTCYFDRVQWWEDPSFKIKKGQADRIDFAVWQVQVRLGSNPLSDLVSLDLVENPRHGTWHVLKVYPVGICA